MTDVTETDDNAQSETSTTDGVDQKSEKTFSQSELDRIVSERIARERSRTADYAELKKKVAAGMSDNERAVNEAEQRGRSAALKDAGARLARAEFRSSASEVGLSKEALDGFLEYADLGRFVGDDGEPDVKAITAAVKRIAGPKNTTNYDGGARSTADAPADMNALIRRAAGLG